jgi:hypothetical protein
MIRKVLEYFGLAAPAGRSGQNLPAPSGAKRQDRIRAAILTLPPLLVAVLVTHLIGAHGLAAFGLWVLVMVVVEVPWWLLLARFNPHERR